MTYWLARSGQDKPEGPYTQAQLRQRYEAGEADMDDQVCLAGTQAWQDLGKLLDLRAWREAYAPRAAPPPLPQVQAGKKRTSGNGGVGCMMMIVGLVLMFIFWPLGLLLIFGAAILDQASVHYICTACGNQTVRTARHCVACKAVFVPESLFTNLAKGLAVGLLCLGLIGWGVWESMNPSDQERLSERKAPQAARAPSVPVPAPSAPAPAVDEPKLWELRASVVEFLNSKGFQVEYTLKPRVMSVRLTQAQTDDLWDHELMEVAQKAVGIWRSWDDGYFGLVIKAADGDYLVSGDTFSGVKSER